MVLSETNEQIKTDLMKFVNGEYDNYFTKEEIAIATEISFLFNHLSVEGDSVIFKYSNDKIKISGYDMPNVFKRSYKSFLRENKLNKLLEE
jgi:hypothetical protein